MMRINMTLSMLINMFYLNLSINMTKIGAVKIPEAK